MEKENDRGLKANTIGDEYLIEFSDLLGIEKEISTGLVIDFDQFQNVIGVEILNLELQAGKGCLKKIDKCIHSAGEPFRYSYDRDTDSFYLKLSKERSFDQKAVNGKIAIDKNGQVISLRIKISKD